MNDPLAENGRQSLVDLPETTDLARRYRDVRRQTEDLCSTLEVEDYVVQSMPDASPVKWHLAHTTWFFETFILKAISKHDTEVLSRSNYLFNSYYNALGERIARGERGLLTRPTVAEVYKYRAAVDERILDFLQLRNGDADLIETMAPLIEIGLNHEQQHQELLLTDLKHAFSRNPLRPVYRQRDEVASREVPRLGWAGYQGGLRQIGFEGAGFAFDNESPRHSVYVEPFELGDRLVTNAEYLAFIEDGGYEQPRFWLSDGWNTRVARGWSSPLYWEKGSNGWSLMTLAGMLEVDPAEPVCHVSFYEADAYASWAGARLPGEAEWEIAAESIRPAGNFVESGRHHPAPLVGSADEGTPRQLFGDVWEWTRSPYSPYPGFKPAAGALGEYNGKFMCNQLVLRGGSCATPASHIRATYRNFFPPDARWQFSGIRLARDV
ncbi:ergothioneine biosynthesis protein EgtB [Singulisphaera sp. PoT]|uniref:ergothioneine biosynthesis protein EgtB n=1 Tax=Singulisphaera sp. PoT TaxID=3411797 RepID=UPI003BF5804F